MTAPGRGCARSRSDSPFATATCFDSVLTLKLMASAIRRLRKMHSRLPDFEALVGKRITEYRRSLETWREHRTALRSELDVLKKETSWNKHH